MPILWRVSHRRRGNRSGINGGSGEVVIATVGQALSIIHLALGFLIEGKAGVVRRCRRNRSFAAQAKRDSEPSTYVRQCRYREYR
jgi:hypothetical protein